MKPSRILMLSASLLAGGGTSLTGPGRVADLSAQTRPIPTTLAKRLAEALDGYRDGGPVWIVASYEFDHAVAGMFTELSGAREMARRLGGDYDVFGPYLQQQDFGIPPVFLMECHDPPTKDWCPWDPPTDTIFQLQDIDSVTIQVFPRGHTPIRHSFAPRRIDAMFFTLSALDKFVYPYYARLYGPDYAKAMRDSLAASIQRRRSRF